jgi:hypothetical protein
MNMQSIRLVTIFLVFVLLYGSRLSKGKARVTPEGLSFGMKPFVAATRVLAVAVYVAYFMYTILTSQYQLPVWFPFVVVIAIGFSMLQLPGTIVLGPTEMTQRFWLIKSKVIRYSDVTSVQAFSAGRAVRVIGDRTVITHTGNHSGAEEFKAEIARRTGVALS